MNGNFTLGEGADGGFVGELDDTIDLAGGGANFGHASPLLCLDRLLVAGVLLLHMVASNCQW